MRLYLTDLILAAGCAVAVIAMVRQDQRDQEEHQMRMFLMAPVLPEEMKSEAGLADMAGISDEEEVEDHG